MPVTNALKRLMQKTRSLSYCIGLVMVVLFVYGLIRYPDLPIRETGKVAFSTRTPRTSSLRNSGTARMRSSPTTKRVIESSGQIAGESYHQGPFSHSLGQNRKSSMRAYVFR